MARPPLTEEEKAAAAAKFGAAAGTPPTLTTKILTGQNSPNNKEKRKQRFGLYLTDQEHNDLREASELEERSQHDFVRRVVFAEVRRLLGKN